MEGLSSCERTSIPRGNIIDSNRDSVMFCCILGSSSLVRILGKRPDLDSPSCLTGCL